MLEAPIWNIATRVAFPRKIIVWIIRISYQTMQPIYVLILNLQYQVNTQHAAYYYAVFNFLWFVLKSLVYIIRKFFLIVCMHRVI